MCHWFCVDKDKYNPECQRTHISSSVPEVCPFCGERATLTFGYRQDEISIFEGHMIGKKINSVVNDLLISYYTKGPGPSEDATENRFLAETLQSLSILAWNAKRLLDKKEKK